MSTKILINAVDSEEVRIAKVKDNLLAEFHVESATREVTQGNIYKGVISRVEPSLQAAFVDYGADRNGFLQKHEIHSDYYQDSHSGDHSINNLVRRGQEIIVQITKDPFMKKGAMLTTFISLPGRCLVLMPGSKTIGISRKIEDEDERQRLKSIAEALKIPEDFGLIARTMASGTTKTKIIRDYRYLMRLWKTIKHRAIKEPAPVLLFKDRNLVLRSIRDYFTPDVAEILIDDPAVFQEAKDFVHIISAKHTRIVKLHKGAKPIFARFQLEDQIASIYENRVALKSGGSIVISQTEALVAIDVNSGKGTHKKSIEQTALMTNLEAAEEVARQLRLRDLGGLIVIDFIDMRDAKHKSQVEKVIKNTLKADKARTRVGRISRFGLMEMSRQRIRPSIDFGTYEPCRHCRGRGVTPSIETLGLSFLRKLSTETLKASDAHVKALVPPDVAEYLLNRKRREILEMEESRRIHIAIEGDATLLRGESNIVFEA